MKELELKEISEDELIIILEKHAIWLTEDVKTRKLHDSRRANLQNTDLRNFDLRMADLTWAILNNADLRGANLHKAVLNRAEFNDADLREAHLNEAELNGAFLERADLRENQNLHRVKFNKAQMNEAKLQGTYFMNAEFQGAFLIGAKFQGAIFMGGQFQGAHLKNAKFNGAFMRETKLQGTDLSFADFEKANLSDANLKGSDLRFAEFYGTDLRSANLSEAYVKNVKYDKDTKYRGIRVETCYGSMAFKRHAQDQDYLEELHENKRSTIKNKKDENKKFDFWLFFWRTTSDYGRSWKQWTALSIIISMIFGFIFMIMGCPDGTNIFVITSGKEYNAFFSPFYYSVVTFTTLGFGDIVPRYWYIELLVTIEVIFGYIMLGGLISIFASKMTRRS